MKLSRLTVWLALSVTMFATGSALAGVKSSNTLVSDWTLEALGADVSSPSSGGPVTTTDILSLRDLGDVSVSPDGRRIAFSVRQASLSKNDYVVRWFVAPVDGAMPPVALPLDGGVPIRLRGATGLEGGARDVEAAAWSPDGKSLAMRRRVGERIELWVVGLTNGHAARVSDGAAQVIRFSWLPSGELVFRTGLDTVHFQRAVEREAEHGWNLDERMTLWAARTPSPLAPDCNSDRNNPNCDLRTWTWLEGGAIRLATADEVRALEKPAQGQMATPGAIARLVGDSVQGITAWAEVQSVDAKKVRPLARIAAKSTEIHVCSVEACTGQFISALGGTRAANAVWFVKRTSSFGPDAQGPLDQAALFGWNLTTNKIKTILKFDGKLDGCKSANTVVICEQSSPTQPPRLVSIDPDRGDVRVLADPNPTFSTKEIPRLRKLLLKDNDGNRGFGKLVYPTGYVTGRRYPLVVVQYRARGFLRGGDPGDEYPIFPLAAQGFFVLAVEMPDDLEAMRTLDEVAAMRKQRDDQAGMRSLVGAIENSARTLIAEGLVDDRRVAITGLSWGAQSVHYALQHSSLFATGIASQGAADISYFAMMPDGPDKLLAMRGMNMGTILPKPDDQIMQTAWSQRPELLRVPLLLNIGQYEALFGLEGISVLKHSGKPVEVRIFPQEGHIKYFPRNFAGLYENNIMWLRYWLKGEEDPRPEFKAQYNRWAEMRSDLESRTNSPRAMTAAPQRGVDIK